VKFLLFNVRNLCFGYSGHQTSKVTTDLNSLDMVSCWLVIVAIYYRLRTLCTIETDHRHYRSNRRTQLLSVD